MTAQPGPASAAPSTSVIETGSDRILGNIDDDGVATIVIDNPDRRNAVSSVMFEALLRALRTVQQSKQVRVVVITGAGDKAFISGADLADNQGRDGSATHADYKLLSEEVDRTWGQLDKPVIAAIRGYCLGVGLMVALRADIRLADSSARFAIPAARLGMGLTFQGVEILAQAVGRAWAAEILFTGRQFSAHEAAAIGLVNRVVPAESFEVECSQLAKSIARNAPLTIAACKTAVQELDRPSQLRKLEMVETLMKNCFDSDDYLEGLKAFSERRVPNFHGH